MIRLSVAIGCVLAVLPVALDAQAIRGTVRDVSTRDGVPATLLTVMTLAGDVVAQTTSDGNGGFLITWTSASAVRLRAERLGYFTSTSAPFAVARGDTVDGAVYIAVTALAIDPLIVEGIARDLSGVLAEIAERRRLGLGRFIDRDDIVRSGAMWVSELLTRIPGVQLESDPRTPTAVQAYARSSLTPLGDGRCPMQVFLNGHLFRHNLGVNIVPAIDVEAIEIYRGLTDTPAEFAGDHARCGVIAIWTTRW
jgi:hypothetical protein